MKDPFRNLANEVKRRRAATIGKKLTKKRGNLTGVCAGLGEYFDVDPILVRAGFIGFSFFFPFVGIPAYIGLSFFLPQGDAEEWGPDTFDHEEFEKITDKPETLRRDSTPSSLILPVCPNCDTVAKPNSKYCHKCGTML